MDRKAYRVPDRIKLYVADTDQAGNATVNVTMHSTTEPGGEVFVLNASGSSGVFTGSVATVTGAAVPDGMLQISNGDSIEVNYFDVSAGVNRTATAHADFIPPVLSGVTSTHDFGRTTVSWTSDEPANSIVRYGTNASLSSLTQAITNSPLSSSHSIPLTEVKSGQTYYFYVVSTDEAGNSTTNNNGGAFYSFVVPPVATVLLIDDYQDPLGFGSPPLSDYTTPLAQLGISCDVWDATQPNSDEPTLQNLQAYRVVIWRVPDLSEPGTAAERAAITNYVNSGGSLLVSSMEILTRLSEVGEDSFIHNVLHVQDSLNDENGSTGAAEVIGVPNDPIGNGLDLVMDYTVYENLWFGFVGPDLSDTITPDGEASTVFRNDYGDVVGLRWPGIGQEAPGRVVFLSFPIDAAPAGSGANDRTELFRNILSFLAPGASGKGTIAFSSSAYTLPSVATIEVGDSDLAGQGTLTVSVTSDTDTNGVTLVLNETTQAGVFTGTLNIVEATNSPAAPRLIARDGDTITVRYHDASSGANVAATATVDIQPPSISNVSSEPDYESAVISWDTSEAADALVQFGESPLLSKTAYSSSLDTSHSVTLNALTPNRIYYYRVVSRDAAGNTVVNDDGGQPYTLHTLTPLFPPWTDNMDSGATNWTLFDSTGSESKWTLGTPANGWETSAHSPPDAWGSNLKGDSISAQESFLISPAIALNDGNQATLTFWHSYDFTDGESPVDIYEFGDLLLLTNNTATPTTLAEYSGASSGWEQERINLTPYVGQVVYLVWQYELFSFDARVRPGWLVDDVSITQTNVASGSIQITNNLWQCAYILTGPLYRAGKGTGLLITNAPPGRYTITYGDVADYQTPAPQTNDLASGSTIVFEGNYTYADVNSNGIPDPWEVAEFGSVDPNRTQSTDTDHDGMTDWQEFVAGTNPTNQQSSFQMTAELTNGVVQFRWPAGAARGYRVVGSTNAKDWFPVSDWMQTTASKPMTFSVSDLTNTAPNLFRVEVQP